MAVLPVLVANICYAISAAAGHIPLCFTYVDGCTSISSTGRHGTGYWLFKAAMLPQAALLFLFWRSLNAPSITPTRHINVARRAGMLGAAFLVIYVVTLGADTPLYNIMRRYGVFVYFIGTFAAMVSVSLWLRRRRAQHHRHWVPAALCALMLLLGLAEIPLGKFGLADNQAENIIEWNFALLMQGWFLALYAALRN